MQGTERPSGNLSLDRVRARYRLHDETVGRAELLAELEGALTNPGSVVSLVGPPGAGKTRLARELAVAAHLDGARVAYCDLFGVDAETELFARVAEACGVGQDAPNARDAEGIGAILEALGEPWLILDDLDGLGSSLTAPDRWMDLAPGTRMVLTARERLGPAEATTFVVRPLRTRSRAPGEISATTEPSPAARLARARFARAGGRAPLSVARAETLAEAAGGLPLAIELVASLATAVGPEEALRELERSALAALPDLERSLQSSWTRLEPPARRALTRCSVFAHGPTPDDLRQLDPGCNDTTSLIAHLARVSLLDALEVEGETRLRPFPVVTELCARQRPDLHARAQREHRALFVARARALVEAGLPQDPASLARLRRMRPELLAAVRHAIDAGDAEDAAWLAVALCGSPAARLPPNRSIEILSAVLDLGLAGTNGPSAAELAVLRGGARKLAGDLRGAEAELLAWSDAPPDAVEPRVRAIALRELSGVFLLAWRLDAAEEALTRAFALHRDIAEPEERAWAWNCRGALHACREEDDEGVEATLEAIAIARNDRRDSDVGVFLTNIAMLHLNRAQASRAAPYLEEAIRRFEDAGNEVRAGRAYYCLGLTHLLDARLEAGEASLRRAAHLSELAGYAAVRADVLWALALTERWRGHLTSARGRLEEACALAGARVLPPTLRYRASLAGVMGQLGLTEAADREMRECVEAIDPAWPERETIAIYAELHALRLLTTGGASPEAAAGLGALRETARAYPEALGVLAIRLVDHSAPLPVSTPGARLVLDADARAMRLDGSVVDCRRRRVTWRLLLALVEGWARGAELDDDELIARIWEGERMSPRSARNRLHVAVSTARKLMNPEIISRTERGYRLECSARFEHRAEPPGPESSSLKQT